MLRWENINHLHLEISALCNAVCPGCRRYPVHGYDILPFLETNTQWTLEQVKTFLPADKIYQVNSILFNGNHGDFITAKESLDILSYFLDNSPNAFIEIHTNGSARSTQWWERFGALLKGRGVVYFALDGLEDTHHLYRRETNWNRIIENAKAFMSTGGKAIWQMIIFDHNSHQVDQCQKLSTDLGFEKFSARYNSRGPILALDKNLNPSRWITDAQKSHAFNKIYSNIYGEYIKDVPDAKIVSDQKKRIFEIKNETYKARQLFTSPSSPGFNKEKCTSLYRTSIFISANWVVSPCCHISGEIEIGDSSRFYDDLLKTMSASNLTREDITASDNHSVPDILDRGNLDWVLNKVETNALTLCHRRCNSEYGYKMQFKRMEY